MTVTTGDFTGTVTYKSGHCLLKDKGVNENYNSLKIKRLNYFLYKE